MDAAELLRRVRRVEIATRGLSDRIFAGEYQSAFKGRGMAFRENREYQAGDEVRAIDWNVTARTGIPHVKVFEEERELTVILMVDVSPSVSGGTRTRTQKDLLTELAAVLAFSAMGNNDKVGAILFTDRIEKFIPPAKGKSHVLRIVRDILDLRPEGKGSDAVGALMHFSAAMKKRTVTFFMSDFKDIAVQSDFETVLKRVGKRHDMVTIHVNDALNAELPSMGWVQLEDPETGVRRWINTSARSIRQSWRQRGSNHQEELTKLMSRCGMDFVSISTEESLVPPLLRLFHERC